MSSARDRLGSFAARYDADAAAFMLFHAFLRAARGRIDQMRDEDFVDRATIIFATGVAA
jgi:hypothetical protein